MLDITNIKVSAILQNHPEILKALNEIQMNNLLNEKLNNIIKIQNEQNYGFFLFFLLIFILLILIILLFFCDISLSKFNNLENNNNKMKTILENNNKKIEKMQINMNFKFDEMKKTTEYNSYEIEKTEAVDDVVYGLDIFGTDDTCDY